MVYFGTFIARCTLKAAIIILIECMTLVGKATGQWNSILRRLMEIYHTTHPNTGG